MSFDETMFTDLLTEEEVEEMVEKFNKIKADNECMFTVLDIYHHFKEEFPDVRFSVFLEQYAVCFPMLSAIGVNFVNPYAVEKFIRQSHAVMTPENTELFQKIFRIFRKHYFGKIIFSKEALQFGTKLGKNCKVEFLSNRSDVIYFFIGHERRHSIQSRRCLQVGCRSSDAAFVQLFNGNDSEEVYDQYYNALHEADANRFGYEFLLSMINQ